MIELPEATTIASQINATLKNKCVIEGNRGNSPHKFAFYSRTAEEYAAILKEKVIGESRTIGSVILTNLDPGYTLITGEGGERILYHPNASTLPKKHQLMLHFSDESFLSVSVQGWGAALLLENAEAHTHPFVKHDRPSPLSAAFTSAYFEGLFSALAPGDPASVKFFMVSKPGVAGVGNGCLQDILWRARLHPRRRAVSLTSAERQALFEATCETLQEMVAKGGRDGDFDLFNQPGGYQRTLHSKAVGTGCPRCGEVIEKAAYLGGSVYFCPRCQTS